MVAVDARQVPTASDTVVSRRIHIKSEYVMTVVPKLAAASQADYEVVQPRPPDYGYTDSLPLWSGCLGSPSSDTPEESPPAEIRISKSPDRIQTEITVTSTEVAGGGSPRESGSATESGIRDGSGVRKVGGEIFCHKLKSCMLGWLGADDDP